MARDVETHLTFGELLAAVEQAGYEVVDARGRAVNEQLLPALEEENLRSAPARVSLREPPSASDETVVADVTAGTQVFHVAGDARGANELARLLRDTAKVGGEPRRGTPP